MPTGNPTPPPCNHDIFTKGSGVCVVDGESDAIERWVKSVAAKANAQVDWHFSGGLANVLHLGDKKSHERVLKAIVESKEELKGHLMSVGEPALYRNFPESSDDEESQGAVIREINGQLVLDDPVAVTMIHAVEKHNCRNTLELNADRVAHFKCRLTERGMTPDQAVIVLLNVDDVHGGPLADILMPGHDWQEIRDRGEIPFARGLAMRDGIQEALGAFDKDAATKLQGMSEVAVVVVDHGVVEVFVA